MKKILSLVLLTVTFASCVNEDLILPSNEQVNTDLQITNKVGIKLETPFVTNQVNMNVKSDFDGVAVIKIKDIANRVVSKEEVNVKVGDNLLKVYTNTLPSSAYRIGLYDKNNVELGITDFNKLN